MRSELPRAVRHKLDWQWRCGQRILKQGLGRSEARTCRVRFADARLTGLFMRTYPLIEDCAWLLEQRAVALLGLQHATELSNRLAQTTAALCTQRQRDLAATRALLHVVRTRAAKNYIEPMRTEVAFQKRVPAATYTAHQMLGVYLISDYIGTLLCRIHWNADESMRWVPYKEDFRRLKLAVQEITAFAAPTRRHLKERAIATAQC